MSLAGGLVSPQTPSMAKAGLGTITQRSDGRWMGRLEQTKEVRGGEGAGAEFKRRRKCVYGRTRAEVRRKMVQVLREMEDASERTMSRANVGWTVGQVVDTFLATKRGVVGESTLAMYRRTYQKYLFPIVPANMPAELFNARTVRLFLEGSAMKQLKPSTRREVHQRFAQLGKYLEAKTGLPNPLAGMKAPSKTRSGGKVRVWLKHEVAAFLAEVEENHAEYLPMFIVLLETGARIGEIQGLKWRFVNLETGTIRIEGQWTRLATFKDQLNTQYGYTTDLKTRNSYRTISVGKRGRAALAALWGEGKGLDEFVFASSTGVPMNRDNLRARVWSKVVRKLGLEDIKIHGLRHTHASQLLSAKVSPRVVQLRLGHADVTITLQTYGHLMPQDEVATLAVVDSLYE